jgi:prevent-host-death family protein
MIKLGQTKKIGDIIHMGQLHEFSSGEFRRDFSDLMNAVRFAHDTVKITRHGKTMGVLISEKEYTKYIQLMNELEDTEDLQAAEKAVKESTEDERISWEQVKKDLDIDV